MSRRPIEVRVSPEEQKQLRHLLRAGIQRVRVRLRALALEQLSLGLTAPAVAKIIHLTPQAVRRIGHRYKRGGLESAQGVERNRCWRKRRSSQVDSLLVVKGNLGLSACDLRVREGGGQGGAG